jgi:hypothetical protein
VGTDGDGAATGGAGAVTVGTVTVGTLTVGTVTVGTVGTGSESARALPTRRPTPKKATATAAAATRISSQLGSAGFGCGRRVGQDLGVAAVKKRDYYEVLGVAREADADAIKRAFHDLARDWHPDVAEAPEAEERFRELAEAYAVLSKREARLLYDRYGYRGRGNQGFDEALWEARPLTVERGENVYVGLELRTFEAEEGTRRVISYDAVVRCKTCMGRGSYGLTDPECEVCGGTGRKRTSSSLDSANLLQIEPCPACVGEACEECGGEGTILAGRRIRLLIPPGVEDGTQLRVSGDGHDAGAGTIPGDLLVRVYVMPPPRDPRAVRYVAFALLLVAIATLILYVVR